MSTPHTTMHGAVRSPASPSQNGYIREPKAYIQRTRPYFDELMVSDIKPKRRDSQVRDQQQAITASQWIWGISEIIGFPSRTRCCAMILYHRLRLYYSEVVDQNVNVMEVACACLFTACKIEDTLKKSSEILAVAYNMRHPNATPINSDSPIVEEQHKRVISIERQILESISFDFRSRNHDKLLIKLARHHKLQRKVAATAWQIAWDAFKTITVLKMTPHELNLACLMLSGRLLGNKVGIVEATEEEIEAGAVIFDYTKYGTSFAEVLECVHDILDLYTDHMNATFCGPRFGADAFIRVRIELNREAAKYDIPANNNNKDHLPNTMVNGHSSSHYTNGESTPAAADILRGGPSSSGLHSRGVHGTVRYILNKDREELERIALQMEEEEEEEEYYYNGGGDR